MITSSETGNLGCPWPVDPGCLSGWEDIEEQTKDRAVALASALMTQMTGGRVTNCPVTIRPCIQSNGCWGFGGDLLALRGSFMPYNWAGVWRNDCACGNQCATSCEITLPGPVGRVDRIRVDGEELPLGDFRIDNGNILAWQGEGDCPLPRTQDMSKPAGEVGTFEVTYLRGYPVDASGSYAMTLLAHEFAKACSGKKCKLPSTVVSVVRNGVSYEIDQGLFEKGRTGIQQVDAYIALWVPDGFSRFGARVYSPGQSRPRFSRSLG